MPGEVRQNLYFVIKEAINNIVKYSGAPHCNISFTIHAEKLIMEICDDGKGFDGAIKSTGHGLDNMRSRIEEIGGKFFVISTPGKGTQKKAELSYPFKIPNSWDRKSKHL
ncbi:MAG TPA: ATP-binding protein [Chitinophagaceae bacterium]|nr:ATP-binding protein [Chitinophagaceae bacterium]